MQRFIRWANVLIVLFTLLTYLAPYVSPMRFWPFAFVGLMYPTLLVINLFFALYWALQRQWRALLSLGTILLGWTHFTGVLGVHFGADPGADVSSLKLMTWNLHGLENFHKKGLPADPAAFQALVYQHRPDVLCVQEFMFDTPEGPNEYLELLREHIGLDHAVWRKTEELAIFSRYPILRSEVRIFGTTNGYRYADVQMGERIIRVYNVHLRSNAITGLTDRVVNSGDPRKRETWRSVRNILGNFKQAARARAEQVEELIAHISNSPYPVVVGGDFNDIPQSYTYQRISNTLSDAFLAAGSGLGITYAGRIPGLRIDYIFTDPQFTPLACERGKVSFSDHRPVIATIKL